MATHEVEVDWSRTLVEQPETGHNRWHPDIPPVVRCDPGDEVVLPTRDAFDGQMGPAATLDTVRAPNLNVVHPLTGPVYVNGAENGDILEVEILHVEPDRYGYTVQVPGFGFLRDQFPEPFMVRWSIADGWASSDDLPGVRVPGAPFMGTIGLAPDRRLLEVTTAREQAALDRGGFVLPPDPTDAVPAGAIAREALRTVPPRETAGNVDIRQLSAGTRLYIPVYAQGGLFSAGDAHFAQGDCDARRREPSGGPHPRRPQRPAEHDRPPRPARRLVAAAGVRHLQRGGRPEGERGRRRPQLRGVGVPATRHLHRGVATPAPADRLGIHR